MDRATDQDGLDRSDSDDDAIDQALATAVRDALPAAGVPRRWIVAFSGGLDSTVLLHALARTSLPPGDTRSALHVHHGLHADADAWATHCAAICDALDIPLQVLRVTVPRDAGDGREAAARDARYAALQAFADRDGDVVLVAHHRDDQAETFVLRALRASGVEALGAMRSDRRLGSALLWRPLLGIGRDGLHAHAREHGLQWIEDGSNHDTDLDRNFLRQRVMPLIATRWPQAARAFAASAALSTGAAGLLDDGDARALAAVRGVDPATLVVTALLDLPAPRRARVLRRWIASLVLPPLPARGVAQIEHDLLDVGPDAEPQFAWAGAVIHRWRDLLHAQRAQRPLPAHGFVVWDGRTALSLPEHGRLELLRNGLAASDTPGPLPREPDPVTAPHAFETPLHVHARQGGERITLPRRRHTHLVRKLMQDLGIPPWERQVLPLLSMPGGPVQAIADLAYSDPFDAWLRAHGCRLHWSGHRAQSMP